MNKYLCWSTADLLYYALLERLVDYGETSSPREQKTRELLGLTLELEDPLQALVRARPRRLNYHFAVAEWWWIASGRNDVEFIAKYNKNISAFSDDGVTFAGAYGPRWRTQIANVIKKLKEPHGIESRQAVVSLWQPALLTVYTKDVPCTLSLQYLVRDGRLSCNVTMRSSDAWLGIPYDLHNFARLQAMVAGELEVQLGSLVLHLGSSHFYERDLEKIRALIKWYRQDESFTHQPLPVLPSLPSVPRMDFLASSLYDQPGLKMIEAWYNIRKVLHHRFDASIPLSNDCPYGEAINAQQLGVNV